MNGTHVFPAAGCICCCCCCCSCSRAGCENCVGACVALQRFTSFTITGSQARRHRDARVLDSWCLLGSVSSEKESECAWWRRSLNRRPNQPTAVSCRLPKALHRPPRFCCLHLLQEAQTCQLAVSVFQLIRDCRLLHMPLAYVSLITTVWT